MREPSIYFSDTFFNGIWISFSATLRASKTRNDYFTLLCEICDFCKKDFLELEPADGKAFFDSLFERNKKGELRKSTISVHFYKLNSICNYIIENGTRYNITSFQNPFSSLCDVSFDSFLTKEHVPDIEMMDKILSMCKADLQLYAAVALIVRCALTSSELCKIRRDSIIKDAKGNCGIVFKVHNGERYVKVPEDIINLIDQVISSYPSTDGTLFVNTRGRALSIRGLQRLYNKYVYFGDDEYCYNMSDIRNGSIAFFLAHDAIERDAIADYVDISKGWLIRYANVIPDLEQAPVDLVNIRIEPYTMG